MPTHGKGGVAGNGQLDHLDALAGGRQLMILLVRRHSGRQEPNRIEPTLFPAALGQQQVPEMDRIKRSSEDAESHCSSATYCPDDIRNCKRSSEFIRRTSMVVRPMDVLPTIIAP
jgi:hypothetical protein